MSGASTVGASVEFNNPVIPDVGPRVVAALAEGHIITRVVSPKHTKLAADGTVAFEHLARLVGEVYHHVAAMARGCGDFRWPHIVSACNLSRCEWLSLRGCL